MNSTILQKRYSELMNLNTIDFQRQIIKKRVDELTQSYENELIQTNNIVVFGCIIIALFEQKLYILDGQHRYFSVKNIYDKFEFDAVLNVIIYKIITKNQLFDYFNKINNVEPIAKWNCSDIDTALIFKKSTVILMNKYLNYISTKSSQIPKINIDDWFNVLDQYRILYCYNITTSEKLIDYIENINKILYNSMQKHKTLLKVSKRLEYFEKKSDTNQLYLSVITIKNWSLIYLNNITIEIY